MTIELQISGIEALQPPQSAMTLLAHDLASPINTIEMWVKLMRSAPGQAVMEQGFAAIGRALTSQKGIVEQIRDYGEASTR